MWWETHHGTHTHKYIYIHPEKTGQPIVRTAREKETTKKKHNAMLEKKVDKKWNIDDWIATALKKTVTAITMERRPRQWRWRQQQRAGHDHEEKKQKKSTSFDRQSIFSLYSCMTFRETKPWPKEMSKNFEWEKRKNKEKTAKVQKENYAIQQQQ